MTKYKHSIQIVNTTNNKKLLEKYKDKIQNLILHIMDINFDFDLSLLIKFKYLDKVTNYVNHETETAYATIIDDKYAIVLNINSLKRIERDNGFDITLSIFHELAHTYDLYHTMHNKFYKIRPISKTHETFEDYLMMIGWTFWTEFFAYYVSYRHYKEEYDYPTKFQIYKSFVELKKDFAEIEPDLDNEAKQKEVRKKARLFITKLRQFTYAIAKYNAGAVMSSRKKYFNYCKKTKENKDYKKVTSICNGLFCRSIKLFRNTYGKGQARKLFDLGKYIIDNIYGYFKIYPIKENYIKLAFYIDE